jgi:methylated-DNA-[protein]-cysteine S-methyltransferase
VLQLARKIGYGRTVAYGELAARAGNSRAARAIGAVMASNPLPIIVPCHRVVASGGAIGGFSAPHGIELKKRLLEMEATAR